MVKSKLNLQILNLRRKSLNKKEISMKDYTEYETFKEKLLKYLKSSDRKKANGYISVDAFLYLKKTKNI
jgi:Fe-S cluster biosynthesis and repair protein YggX